MSNVVNIGRELKKLEPHQIEAFLKELVASTGKRFKQEMLGEWGEEEADRVLREYRAKVARYSWKHAQSSCKFDEDGPVLMPDNTRLYYRKGNTEIVITEQPPKVRLMKFRGGLVSRDNTSIAIGKEEAEKIHYFSLALPYVVFVFKFDNGMFTEVKCAFCDRPLKRLEEKPLRPYLSNIDTNLSVCLGTSFNKRDLVKGDIYQQVSYTLSNFWQTAYSDEWATHFWNLRAHFQNTDQRLATLKSWENESSENPLFVVEDVGWLQYNEESFGDMMVRMLEYEVQNQTLHEELYNGLCDNFLEDIKKSLRDELEMIQDRLTFSSMQATLPDLLSKAKK